MSVEMPLNEDHEVLGSEFCSGYSDALGRWNPGFYCPPGGGGREDASDALFCCGGATYKYCCTQREHATAEDLGNLPLVLGAALGATAALAIIILVCCCCCSCCSLHKSRNSSKQANDGPVYRMQTSSTASGVANMYSFSNQNSLATTPIDTAASQIMVELEPGSVGRSGTMGRGNTFCASGARTLQRNGGHDPPPPYDAGKSAHHTLPHQRHHHHHQQQQPQQPQHPQHLYPPDGLPQPPHQHQPQAQAQGRQHFTLPRSHGMQSARSPITTFPQGPSQGFAAHQAHPTATLSRVPRAVPASVPVVPVALVRPPPGPMPPDRQAPPAPPSAAPSTRRTAASRPTPPRDSSEYPINKNVNILSSMRHPPSNAVPLNASGYGMTHSTSSTFQPCPPLQQQQPPPQQQQQQQQHPKQHLSQGIVGLPPPPSIPAPVPMGPPMGPMPPMGQPGVPLVGHSKGVATTATTPLGPPANAPVPATTNGGPGHMNGSTGCELSPGDTLYRSTKF